jgi:hypothetical protein
MLRRLRHACKFFRRLWRVTRNEASRARVLGVRRAGVFVNYTSEQFRLQAALCLEKAAAQLDEALRADWLHSAEHLLALAQESANTLTLEYAAPQAAEVAEFKTAAPELARAAVAAS